MLGLPIQWLIALFALYAVWRAGQAYQAGTLDMRKFFYWLLFWTVVVVVIFLPQTADVMAQVLGVGRGVDAVLYLSVLLLFYALFQVSRKTDKLERSLTELVRRLAREQFNDDTRTDGKK